MENNTTRRGFLAATAATLAGCQNGDKQKAQTETRAQNQSQDLQTVTDNLEPTTDTSEQTQEPERSLEESVQLIDNDLKDTYSPVEEETIVETFGPDGNPTVSIELDMEEVYNQTPFEDFGRQNVRFLDEAGSLEQFTEDVSVPVTDTFMNAVSLLDPNSEEYSSINIDLVGSNGTSFGLTIGADRAHELNESLKSDYESGTAPSARMEDAMDHHGAVGSESDRNDAIFYVSEGDSHTIKLNGEETSFIVDDTYSNERTSLLDLDLGEGEDGYRDADHEYEISDGVFLKVGEINPNNERYGNGASFRIGLEGDECSREISGEIGESSTYDFGDVDETVEYLNVPENGSGALSIGGRLVDMDEGDYELSDSGVLYRMDQTFRTDQYGNGEMELEAIFNCS